MRLSYISYCNIILAPEILYVHKFYLIVLSITVLILILCKSKLNKPRTPQNFRTIHDLPHVRHFSFWVPSQIDGLAGVYFLIREGIRIWDKWSVLANQAPMFTIPDYTFSRTKLIVINSPDFICKILNSVDPNILQKPDTYNTFATELIKDGLISSPVKIWGPHRKKMNQFLINDKNLPHHFKVINKYGLEMFARLDGKIIGGNKLCPLIHDTFMNIISDIALGPSAIEQDWKHNTSSYCCKLRSTIRYRLTHPEFLVGPLWSLNPKKKEYDNCMEYFKGYVSKRILSATQDLIDKEKLGSSCAKHLFIHEMSEKEIQVEVSTLLAVAHETTAPVAHFLFQFLAEHPEIQEQCRNEIDLLFNSKPNSDLTIDDLSSMKYLERCIFESLRLVPVIPIIGRKICRDIYLDGIKIEKGTVLVINTWLLHKNPDIYPEPEKYDPDRFLSEEVKKRHPYAYLPFSSGPRNCIGYKIALMTIKHITALLLRRYRIKTRDKFADMKLLYEVTLSPERKFNIFLEKR